MPVGCQPPRILMGRGTNSIPSLLQASHDCLFFLHRLLLVQPLPHLLPCQQGLAAVCKCLLAGTSPRPRMVDPGISLDPQITHLLDQRLVHGPRKHAVPKGGGEPQLMISAFNYWLMLQQLSDLCQTVELH